VSGVAGGGFARYDETMDALRRDDIERARTTSLEEKARQTLEMMRTGVRLKRAGLRARFPSATPEEIEAMVQRWLERDD
jgi:hypothetical protein